MRHRVVILKLPIMQFSPASSSLLVLLTLRNTLLNWIGRKLHFGLCCSRDGRFVILSTYRSFAGASQLKICDFSGENFKGFEVL